MDLPTHNMRGSQRALKMLQASLAQNKAAAATGTTNSTVRPQWPPLSTSSHETLDPNSSTQRQSSIFASFGGASAMLRQKEQTSSRDAVPLVRTPVSRRVQHNYASPEASVPSNGGVKFLCDNSVGMLDLETSRLSSIAGNNSNFEFSQSIQENTLEDISSTNNNTIKLASIGVAQRVEHIESIGNQETRSSMCFSLGDGKVTSIVTTSDGAYCIAGFSSGAIKLFDLTKEGNMDAEDRFGYRIGFIESQRGSVQVRDVLFSRVVYPMHDSFLVMHATGTLGARQCSTRGMW